MTIKILKKVAPKFDIIGVYHDGKIYTGKDAMPFLNADIDMDKLITRELAVNLYQQDKVKWRDLLTAKTLMGFDATGAFCFVKGGLLRPKRKAKNDGLIEKG